MAARGILANPAMYAGYDTLPLQCLQDWVNILTDKYFKIYSLLDFTCCGSWRILDWRQSCNGRSFGNKSFAEKGIALLFVNQLEIRFLVL